MEKKNKRSASYGTRRWSVHLILHRAVLFLYTSGRVEICIYGDLGLELLQED